MSNEYQCSLDEASIAKAAKELNEDPKERQAVLKKFREIIAQQVWLKTPTDAEFLLAFLRVRKFSLLEASKTLENYWSCRTDIPEWFRNVDVTDPDIQKVFGYGAFLPIPGRDAQGRKVVLIRAACFDPSTSVPVDTILKVLFAIYSIVLRDENTQVNGIVFIEDITGFTLKHQAYYGLDCTRKFIRTSTKGFPGRYKSLIFYNVDPVFMGFYTLIKPFMPEKLLNRLQIIGKSLVPLYESVDKSMLPQEYLPDDYTGPNAGTMQSLIELNKKIILKPENREYLLNLSSGKYGVDKKKKPKEFVQESFRFKSTD